MTDLRTDFLDDKITDRYEKEYPGRDHCTVCSWFNIDEIDEYIYLSECCGVEVEPESFICPDCKEHTGETKSCKYCEQELINHRED